MHEKVLAKQHITSKLISVIVPVYGVEKYLNQCVQSLVNQTYSNIEIILVDDGSPDRCGEICDSWSEQDSRVLTIHTANYGVSHARNVGLDNAKGDYIGFVDPDDWIDEDMYELMINELLTSGTDICGGGYVREGEYKGKLSLQKDNKQVLDRESAILKVYSISYQHLLFWELCDKLFCKEVINDLRIDEHLYVCEDKLFFWQVMKNVNSVSYLPLFKYHYRMRHNSMTHSSVSTKNLTAFKAECKIWESSKNETTVVRELIDKNYKKAIYNYTKNLFLLDYKYYRKIILQHQLLLRQQLLSVFFQDNFTLHERIGVLFCCLPYRLCVIILHFIFGRKVIKQGMK